MAGAGWLARALSAHGLSPIATDFDARAKWGKRPAVYPVKPEWHLLKSLIITNQHVRDGMERVE